MMFEIKNKIFPNLVKKKFQVRCNIWEWVNGYGVYDKMAVIND